MKKKLGIALLIILVIAGLYALWMFVISPLLTPAIPEPVVPGPGEQATVDVDDIDDINDFAQYTAGRPIPPPTTDRTIAPISGEDHVYGNPNAAISFVQYSSLTDKYAKIMYPALREYFDSQTDANWVYRHYPDPDKPYDYAAAYAAECVWLQKANRGFWRYVDLAFTKGFGSEQDVYNHAEAIGADMAEMELCMTQGFTENDVKTDKRNAQVNARFFTIPSFFFVHNETGEVRFMQGADTVTFVDRVIQVMLEESDT